MSHRRVIGEWNNEKEELSGDNIARERIAWRLPKFKSARKKSRSYVLLRLFSQACVCKRFNNWSAKELIDYFKYLRLCFSIFYAGLLVTISSCLVFLLPCELFIHCKFRRMFIVSSFSVRLDGESIYYWMKKGNC